MARGGARKGAGRKPSALTKTTREAAVDATKAAGVTPIEVMAFNLKFWYEAAQNLTDKIQDALAELKPEDFRENPEYLKDMAAQLKNMLFARERAQECAVDMAPYRHPRLANIEVTSRFEEPEDGPPRITAKTSVKDAAARYEALLNGTG